MVCASRVIIEQNLCGYVCFLRWATMASMSPGIVYSLAWMSTRNPSSRRVDEVTGPMEARLTFSSCFIRFLVIHCAPADLRDFGSKATKFFTVDELVKVMTSG